MRKRVFKLALIPLALLLLLPAVSCTPTEPDNSGTILVMVSILPQADFVKQVGGEMVSVEALVPPGAGPHTYEPTPEQMVKLSQASLYVKVGSGVDFELSWMERMLQQNPAMALVDCSAGVTLLGSDPHIWNSPVNAAIMVENIYRGLVDADPAHEAFYRQNADRYQGELAGLDADIRAGFDGFTNRRFLIYHPAFGYLAQEYNLEQVPIEFDGKSPTPQVMQQVVETARQYHLQYIFIAPQFAIGQAEAIASEIDAVLVNVDPLPELYITNMRSVAEALSKEME